MYSPQIFILLKPNLVLDWILNVVKFMTLGALIWPPPPTSNRKTRVSFDWKHTMIWVQSSTSFQAQTPSRFIQLGELVDVRILQVLLYYRALLYFIWLDLFYIWNLNCLNFLGYWCRTFYHKGFPWNEFNISVDLLYFYLLFVSFPVALKKFSGFPERSNLNIIEQEMNYILPEAYV